ncbi:hypothetical protein JTB14_033564 [Gonioctena quinquepunctata]|nr:hypothetical protein JTB14_033564 [Gonioctena quinquepunctata]
MFGTKYFVKLGTSEIVNYTNYQTVRWRKPLWMPTAKSKVFRVPTRPVIPEDEKIELMRLHNNYRTQINSLRKFFYHKHNIRFLASTDPEEQKRLFEEDFQSCTELNNEWNEKQRVLREEYFADRLQKELDFAKERIGLELIKAEENQEEIEEIVRREKGNAKYFISAENLDEAIENAIENPVDYNFALDSNGEQFCGRDNVFSEKVEVSVKQ